MAQPHPPVENDDLLLPTPLMVTEAERLNTLSPGVWELEVNFARLLAGALALIARSPLLTNIAVPSVALDTFFQAIADLDGRNRCLIVDATRAALPEPLVRRNLHRLSQLEILGRVALHLDACHLVLSEGAERQWATTHIGPVVDSLFVLGITILAEVSEEMPQSAEWGLPTLSADGTNKSEEAVDAALHQARVAVCATGVLTKRGRKYCRATLWSLQVGREALLALKETRLSHALA